MASDYHAKFVLILAKIVVSNERCMHFKPSFIFNAVNILVPYVNFFVTSSDMSNNLIEEMPPALFSKTSNLKELYV